MIKPPIRTFDPLDTDPKWGWFWKRGSLAMLFNERNAIAPHVLIDGRPAGIVDVDNPPTDWIDGPYGPRSEYMRDGGGSPTQHIPEALLPPWFPGLASTPYTALALCLPKNVGGGVIANTLHLGPSSNAPYFLWFEPALVAFNLTGGTSITRSITLDTEQARLYGSTWDGETAWAIFDRGRTGAGAAVASIASASGPLNIGTRSPLHAGTTRAFDGFMDLVVFTEGSLTDEQIAQLADDPFGPFRPAPRRFTRVPARYRHRGWSR